MNKKILTKIMALGLAGVMMLGMSATAFATPIAGTATKTTPAVTDTTNGLASITIKSYFNENKTGAKHPATKFSYSIGTDGVTKDDTNGIEVGTGTPTITASTDAWDTVNATAVSDDIIITFPTYSKSGIYRYKVTQAALTQEQQDIGLENEATDKKSAVDKYLDVYVDNTFKVTGAVLFDTDSTLSKDTSSDPNTMSYSKKTDGFRNVLGDNTAPDPENPNPGDDRIGYSVTITKKTSGSMADGTMQYPFQLKTEYTEGADTNTTVAGLELEFAKTTGTASTIPDTTTIGSETAVNALKIAKDNTVTIYGLPKNAVLKLKETIDAAEGYDITSTVANMASNTGITTAVHSESTYTTTGTVNGTGGAFEYTNTRNAISPTGVVMRFAPYLLIMGGAIALILVSRRRKEQEEA